VKEPRLRTVSKVKRPYPLGKFPKDFVFNVGREIVYILATSVKPTIEGKVWERVFAGAIGAKWKPSNVGLDDIVLGIFAWGAKTVKNLNPHKAKKVRLISGRNSPKYSYGETALDADPQILGTQVLEIWNARVEAERNKFSSLRTVVLIKPQDFSGGDVLNFAVFETETFLYPPDRYTWQRNKNENLEGIENKTGAHRFTWQPHGSQFTIIEEVPSSKVCFKVKRPQPIDRDVTLKALGFDRSWIEIVKDP
jgi:hypothetical protein